MTTAFLHGIETVEISNGVRPVQTVKSSVIGIVGTANGAQADTKAALAVPGPLNGNLAVTAKGIGTIGNGVSLAMVNPGTANAVLGVVVTANAIVVNLATNASSLVTSTAAQVVAAIVASVPANALVAVVAGGTGAGVVTPLAATFLTGGADEPFPLNVPVLVTGPTMAARLGTVGTLRDAYSAIAAQGVDTCIVVRVQDTGVPATTLANVVGAEAPATGVWQLLNAESVTGQVPRILCAPGFTTNAAANPASAVTLGLLSVARRIRAVVIADGPSTTEADAITDRNKFGSDRLFIVDPQVRVLDTLTGGFTLRPASGYVAGILSRMDNTNGFWWSPSNQIVEGISGTARPIPMKLNSRETEANRLNEQDVAVIVQANGFRLWGNRTTATDPLWTFLPVRRTADMIYESVEAALLWAMDRPFSEQLLRDVRDTVQAYIDNLVARGAILGGQCWLDPDLNTQAELRAGRVYLNFDIEPPAPLEHLVFRAFRNGSYYEELLADVNAAA